MMTAPSLIHRYCELHQAELRAEIQRGQGAATCQPDASAMRRTPSWLRIAATSLLTTLSGGGSPGSPVTGTSDLASRVAH